MSKFLDVKGVKGLSKWMKEVASTATTGKHDNELIGRCKITLRVSNIYVYHINFKFIIVSLLYADNTSSRITNVVQS